MMFLLALNILQDLWYDRMGDGKCGISILPGKILVLWKCLMNPTGRAGFDLLDGFRQCDGWRKNCHNMKMIFRAVGFEHLSAEFSNDPAGIFHELGQKIRLDQRAAFFCGIDDVVVQVCI